jgi:hypothetical protein
MLSSASLAVDKLDYSGSYTLTGAKGSFKYDKATVWTLKVVQSAAAIEVTRVMDGKLHFNKFPLDGTEGVYNSSGGIPGKCKAQFKGKSLFLDSFVTTRPQPNGPAVQLHTRERWELSADSKILTIRSDVDFPGMPVNPVDPWSEIYTRN